jgi:hypothetical protein
MAIFKKAMSKKGPKKDTPKTGLLAVITCLLKDVGF